MSGETVKLTKALQHATGLSNGWWRDVQIEETHGGSESNRWLAYGRAQGAATAVKDICDALGLDLPDGWTDMPPGRSAIASTRTGETK